jgi:hypothetical protein
VTLSLAVAGCGSDDGSGSTTSTAGGGASTTATSDPAGPAQPVSGTGYRTLVPAKWRDNSSAAEGSAIRIDLLYIAPTGNDFNTNVVVTREDPEAIKGKKVEDVEEQIRTQAAASLGAEKPDAEDPTKLDGEDAARWTLRRKQGDQPILQRQLIAIHDDALYTVTLSSSATDDDGEAALQTVITGWRWK